MPGQTSHEAWRYPLLAEPVRRTDLQHLAQDMERSLTRVRGHTDFARHRRRVVVERPATGQTVPANTSTPLVYTAVVEDTATMWNPATPTVIVAPEDGLYWIDARTEMFFPGPSFTYTSLRVETLPGPTVWAGRSFGSDDIIWGLSALIHVAAGQQVQTPVVWQGSGGPLAFGFHRLACQLVARCARPLNSNPYFDYTADGWSASGGTFTRSTTGAHHGTASGLLVPDGVSAVCEVGSEQVSVQPGTPYRARGWVRNAAARPAAIGINWYDVAHGFVAGSSQPPVALAAATWTHFDHTATAPAAARFGSVKVSMTGTPPASHVLRVDDVWIAAPCA